MQYFEFLPHTADIRMRVEASTLQELFHAALQGMHAVLHPSEINTGGERRSYQLRLSSLDSTTLLIDFLSDVLTASYEHKAIFDIFQITAFGDTSIEAELSGHMIEQFDEDIKAVTYHEADIHQNAKGNWETVVIFDI